MSSSVNWNDIETRIRQVAFQATQLGVDRAVDALAAGLLTPDKVGRIPLVVRALRERYDVDGNDATAAFKLYACYASEVARTMERRDAAQYWVTYPDVIYAATMAARGGGAPVLPRPWEAWEPYLAEYSPNRVLLTEPMMPGMVLCPVVRAFNNNVQAASIIYRAMLERDLLPEPAELAIQILQHVNPNLRWEMVQYRDRPDGASRYAILAGAAAQMYAGTAPYVPSQSVIPPAATPPPSPFAGPPPLPNNALAQQIRQQMPGAAGGFPMPTPVMPPAPPALPNGNGLPAMPLPRPMSRSGGKSLDAIVAEVLAITVAEEAANKISFEGMRKIVRAKVAGSLQGKAQQMRPEQVEKAIERLTPAVIEQDGMPLTEDFQVRKMSEAIKADLVGFGAIQKLIMDNDITEIMVNGPKQVYVERKGKIELSDVKFVDDDDVLNVIRRIVVPLGRMCDEANPLVDARLPDGSRVNAIIPPLALDGPSITIRKFSKSKYTVADLIKFGSMTEQCAEFLRICVEGRMNIVVSGGTGSGKTTLLNVLSSFIPEEDRIVTIEDSAELQLHQPHVVRLETRPANMEGTTRIGIRELVINSLRMRPDRIVIGECRGGEALDMLQAMNTGHDGSLTTAHSNAPRETLSRLETMVMMAGVDLPLRAIRDQVSKAVNVIVHQARLQDGSRKITHVTEVIGMEGDIIVLQDIFRYIQTGLTPEGKVIGAFKPTGIRPKIMEHLKSLGITVPTSAFEDQGGHDPFAIPGGGPKRK